MEYVYKLNLPSVEHVFLETFKGFNDDDKNYNYQYREDLKNIIRPEWLAFKNFKWDHLLYFKKQNVEGRIHTDIKFNIMDTKYGMDSVPWGVTWVYEGDGVLDYWHFDQVTLDEVTNGSDNNNKKGVVRTYSATIPPVKSYKLLENNCYLVSGKFPHKATGFGGRKVISLRTSEMMYDITWEEIVDIFKEYM